MVEVAIAIPLFLSMVLGIVEFSHYLMFRGALESGLHKAANLASIVKGLDSNDESEREIAYQTIRTETASTMLGAFIYGQDATSGSRLVMPEVDEDADFRGSLKLSPIQIIIPQLTESELEMFLSSGGEAILRRKLRTEPLTVKVSAVYQPLLFSWIFADFEQEFTTHTFREIAVAETEPVIVDCNGQPIIPGELTECYCTPGDLTVVQNAKGDCVCREGLVPDPNNLSTCTCADSNAILDTSTGECITCPLSCKNTETFLTSAGQCSCCPKNLVRDTENPDLCVCPSYEDLPANKQCASDYKYFDSDACKCKKCPSGLYRPDNSDVYMCTGCYVGYSKPSKWAEWSECSCDIEAVAETCKEALGENVIVDEDKCSCGAGCPEGWMPDSDKLSCVCDRDNLKCKGDSVKDESYCKCIPCYAPYFLSNSSHTACICNSELIGELCNDLNRPYYESYDQTWCSCGDECPEGTVLSDDGTECYCPEDSFTCPADQIKSTSVNYCKCMDCWRAGHYANAEQDNCECDTAYWKEYCNNQNRTYYINSDDQCNCGSHCPEGTKLNDDGTECVCDPETNGTFCPEDQWAQETNSGECTCQSCPGELVAMSPGTIYPWWYSWYYDGVCTCPYTNEICSAELNSIFARAVLDPCSCVDPCSGIECELSSPSPYQDSDGDWQCKCTGEP